MVWVSRHLWTDQYSKARPSSNLSARWFGPFQITKRIGKNTVQLRILQYMGTHSVVYVSLTKPVEDKPLHLQQAVPPRTEALKFDEDRN